MADMLVLKIKHNSTLRRVSLAKGLPLTYSALQKKIYELFSLSAEDSLTLTYVDNEGDVVTIADDSDVTDAVVHQGLNPLRLEVNSESKRVAPGSVVSSTRKSLPSAEASPSLIVRSELVKQAEVVQEVKAAAGVALAAPAASAPPAISTAPAAPAERKSAGVVPMPAGERVIHHGVQCDVCKVIPLLGPRFKSNTNSNYDLCKSCFDKEVLRHGVDKSEYNRIDRPLFRPCVGHPFWQNSRPTGPRHGALGAPPSPPFFNHSQPQFSGSGSFGGRPFSMNRGCSHSSNRSQENRLSEGKLDGRFVKDVSVHDGTEFAPNTKFVKIWRLRNSGTLPWPQHTQLVYVGGDQLGTTDDVTLQVGGDGLAAGEEIEVAVELSAPERPGRYVSHWRLLAPGGPKFGHRVWALIHVVANGDPSPQVAHSVQEASNKDPTPALAPDSPMLLPTQAQAPPIPIPIPTPSPLTTAAPQQVDVTASLIEQLEAVRANADIRSELADLLSEVQSVSSPPAQLAGAGAAGGEKKGEGMTEEGSLGGFAMVNMPSGESQIGEEVAQTVASFVLTTKKEAAIVKEEGVGEEVLVGQLVQMGFLDPVLNLAVLKQNKLDLQKTLDELVSAADWDPMMEELEEMGFVDKTMIRRLLFKNKGELKLVVKDLVHIYKAAGGRK